MRLFETDKNSPTKKNLSKLDSLLRSFKKIVAVYEIKAMLLMLGGVGAIALYCLEFQKLKGLAIFGFAILTAGAASVAGGLLGFIFGLPHVIDQKEDSHRRYKANTSLEQISDWLTKILIGISLVQFNKVVSNIYTFAGKLTSGLGDKDSSQAFAVLILCYFFTSGFLTIFLWTRLHISVEIKRIDDAIDRVDQLERKLDIAEKHLSKVRHNPSNR